MSTKQIYISIFCDCDNLKKKIVRFSCEINYNWNVWFTLIRLDYVWFCLELFFKGKGRELFYSDFRVITWKFFEVPIYNIFLKRVTIENSKKGELVITDSLVQ